MRWNIPQTGNELESSFFTQSGCQHLVNLLLIECQNGFKNESDIKIYRIEEQIIISL